MKVTVLGACKEVTGSMFLIEYKGHKVIVDCGLYQGGYEAVEKNADFPFDVKELDAALITHAHLDHSGRLPMLEKFGFAGQVYATEATCDLLKDMLLDSAKIQEEDFERKLRKNPRRGLPEPILLYSSEDVYNIFSRLSRLRYDEKIEVVEGLFVTFKQNGHILGSASIEVMDAEGHKILFSGDVGGFDRNIMPDPEMPIGYDYIFCESTYGNRLHRTFSESVDELADAINDILSSGGNVLIPTFALERTQDLLYVLRELTIAKRIPRNPIFLDSPLAINITKWYNIYNELLDSDTLRAYDSTKDPFIFENVHVTRSGSESRALNTFSGVTIMAGSGMCTGGRIKHHLKHNLWKSNSGVIFVGFQAKNTLGRKIVDGAEFVDIEGEKIAVRAKIHTINGFSAHGDRNELAKWLEGSKEATIVLNHGEISVIEQFRDFLESDFNRTVIIGDSNQPIKIEKRVGQ